MKQILFGLALAGTAWLGAGSPAAAHDYAYCLQSPGLGIPGDCSYSSYRQCMAAASGRLANCAVNPRWAFRHQRYRH